MDVQRVKPNQHWIRMILISHCALDDTASLRFGTSMLATLALQDSQGLVPLN